MPKPISTDDPILAALPAELPPASEAALLSDAVNLINRSPSLLTEINQLDATALPGGGTAFIQLQSGENNGGNTYYHSPVINIAALVSYDDSQTPYWGGSLTAGQTEFITPAGTLVGILAHEIGHWGDAQLGPIYSGAGLQIYTLEQAVATEFASEGKAATSQYTAMSQVQASEATNALPAGMANGNLLFDVTGQPAQDTILLQQVQSLAASPSPYAAIVSYLGSQFWDVPVDDGTYLSTMWGGYGDAGASNDLGIDEARIVGYQVSESSAGTLQGCTIKTASSPSGPALTYQIACPIVGQQQARILDTASGALLATVGTVVTAQTGAVRLALVADGFSFTILAQAAATVQGDRNRLTLSGGSSLVLAGSGNTVSGAAAGNTVTLGASASAVIAQGGGTIELQGDAASATVSGAGSVIQLLGNDTGLTASGSSVTLASGIVASVRGSNDTIAVAIEDRLVLTGISTSAGGSNSVGGSSANLVLNGSQAVAVTGNQDVVSIDPDDGGSDIVSLSGDGNRLFGGVHAADLTLALAGRGAMVSLTAGNATITGGGAQTTVFGGASTVDYAGGGGILVLGSGASTVSGGGAGTEETVFGGSSDLTYQGSREYADVIGGTASCTIHAGAGGGWYGGGIAGHNSLTATGAGTVLDAGGNGDTLVGASGGGTFLVAASGNETLYGGNQTGLNTAFLGSGSDVLVAGSGGSLVDTGSGSATVFGGGGRSEIWGGTGGADLFVAGTGGQLEIHGFRTGTDHLVSGPQAVSAVSAGDGSTVFTLSSGATITLAGVETQAGAVFV